MVDNVVWNYCSFVYCFSISCMIMVQWKENDFGICPSISVRGGLGLNDVDLHELVNIKVSSALFQSVPV